MYLTGKRKYYVFTCVVVLLVLGASLFSKPETSKPIEEKTVAYGKNEDFVFEIVYKPDTAETVLVKDGLEVEVLSKLKQDIQEALTLPKETGVGDITLNPQVSENAWDSDLVSSVEYVNKLEKEGFKVTQEVGTSQYVELILSKGKERKRVIILRSLLIVADLGQDAKVPDVLSIVDKYKYQGGK